MTADFRYFADEWMIPSCRIVMKPQANNRKHGGAMQPDDSGRIHTMNIARADGGRDSQQRQAPWALQQYLNGQIDLDRELMRRFPGTPVMSQIHTHNYGELAHGLAHIATQDGATSLMVEADGGTHAAQFTFLASSMVGLKFNPARLSNTDRRHWLDTLRRAEKPGEIAFLWGASRWESDYLICAPRRYFTNVYAFSPLHVEAAARLTREVTLRLVEWLEGFWQPAEEPPRAPKLNTW